MAIARDTKVPAPVPTEGEPAPSGSIFKKAAALTGRSVLVFGSPSSGKSTWVKEDILRGGLNPLWISFSNTAALVGEEVATWDVGSPTTWNQFNNEVVLPMQRRALAGYTAVVLDGLDILLQHALAAIVSEGKTPERSEWTVASKMVWRSLLQLRDAAGSLYATMDVVVDPQSGGRKLNWNPFAKSLLLPLLPEHVFVSIVRERGADQKPTGNILHVAQTNPALALEFTAPKM